MIPRTTTDFIKDLRRDLADAADVDDDGQPRDTLWSDDDLLSYLNSAAERLASDTLGLRKGFTFQVEAGNPRIPLPASKILDIYSAGWNVPDFGTKIHDLKWFDLGDSILTDDYGQILRVQPDYNTTGNPRYFTRDFEDDTLRLYPIPAVAGVMTVFAYVVPDQLFAGSVVPFRSNKDWDLLLLWAKNLAYRKQDADTVDLTRADAYRSEYLSTVLDRRSELDRITRDGGIMKPR